MNKRTLKTAVSLLVFLVGFAGTYLLVRNASVKNKQSGVRKIGREAIDGVTVGEEVALPTVAKLDQTPVALGGRAEKNFFCVFFSVECPGCSNDVQFWRDLREESGKRGVGFYLIGIDNDRANVADFAAAHGFSDLPVYFDPHGAAAGSFKISFVPQYLLMDASGRVLGRWNGVRRYKGKQHEFDKLSQLFQPVQE